MNFKRNPLTKSGGFIETFQEDHNVSVGTVLKITYSHAYASSENLFGLKKKSKKNRQKYFWNWKENQEDRLKKLLGRLWGIPVKK